MTFFKFLYIDNWSHDKNILDHQIMELQYLDGVHISKSDEGWTLSVNLNTQDCNSKWSIQEGHNGKELIPCLSYQTSKSLESIAGHCAHSATSSEEHRYRLSAWNVECAVKDVVRNALLPSDTKNPLYHQLSNGDKHGVWQYLNSIKYAMDKKRITKEEYDLILNDKQIALLPYRYGKQAQEINDLLDNARRVVTEQQSVMKLETNTKNPLTSRVHFLQVRNVNSNVSTNSLMKNRNTLYNSVAGIGQHEKSSSTYSQAGRGSDAQDLNGNKDWFLR